MEQKTKAEQVKELAETITDPVFKRSLLEIAKSLELASKFKRIDMSFLQIRGASNLPKFALLEYGVFKIGLAPCYCSKEGFCIDGTARTDGRRFGELLIRGDYFSEVQAYPKVVIPDSVDALVEGCKDDFDEILIAWEADWQPRDGDPIVIGRKNALYFLVASWDMTELESFVANTLTN